MNKLNKIGLVLLAITLLTITIASAAFAAPAMPHPVFGKVIVMDHPLPLEEVTLTVCDYRLSSLDNCVAKQVSTFETDSTGSYVFELASICPLCREGDFIKLKACTGHVACEKIVEVSGTFNELNFNIASAIILVPGDDVIIPGDTQIIPMPLSDEDKKSIAIIVAGELIDLLDYEQTEGFRWWHGMLAIISLGLAGGCVWMVKTMRTIMQKIKAGKYKK